MKFRHSLKTYSLIGLSAVSSLLAAYGILTLVGQHNPPSQLHVSSAVHCAFSDKSFCKTEQKIKSYVSSKDISDILENQLPVYVTCPGSTKFKSYCATVDSGLVLQLFHTQQGKTSSFMTRNKYITFYNAYFHKYGPFSLSKVARAGAEVVMRFTNQSGTRHYSLTFTKSGPSWTLAYPMTD